MRVVWKEGVDGLLGPAEVVPRQFPVGQGDAVEVTVRLQLPVGAPHQRGADGQVGRDRLEAEDGAGQGSDSLKSSIARRG